MKSSLLPYNLFELRPLDFRWAWQFHQQPKLKLLPLDPYSHMAWNWIVRWPDKPLSFSGFHVEDNITEGGDWELDTSKKYSLKMASVSLAASTASTPWLTNRGFTSRIPSASLSILTGSRRRSSSSLNVAVGVNATRFGLLHCSFVPSSLSLAFPSSFSGILEFLLFCSFYSWVFRVFGNIMVVLGVIKM